MEPVTRAKTCQNCMHAMFKQRNSEFYGSGKNINGLCMKYADEPMPPEPKYALHGFFAFQKTDYHSIVHRFKDARRIEELPTFEEFQQALDEAPSYLVSNKNFGYFLGNPQDWYSEEYRWCAWWIRNWQTVAERKVDRTTVCAAWDGKQTSKFYKPKKER